MSSVPVSLMWSRHGFYLFADYPSTTSITIIKTKPTAKPIVERLVWAPWAVY